MEHAMNHRRVTCNDKSAFHKYVATHIHTQKKSWTLEEEALNDNYAHMLAVRRKMH